MNIENGNEEVVEKGGNDGSEIEAGQEANVVVDEQGGNADADNGGEAGEASENGGENEGQDTGQEESSKPDPGVDLKTFKEEVFKKIEEMKAEKEERPREITEEQWVAHEKEWGVPRGTIRAVTNQSIKLYQKVEQLINSRLGGIEKEMALSSLAKEPGFSDVGSLKSGIEEFLKDYDQKHHSNPVLLKKAAIFARGLKSSSAVKKVMQNNEKNRQVLGRIKTGTGGSGTRTGTSKPLTQEQREVAEMLPGGEAEYKKLKASKGFIAA